MSIAIRTPSCIVQALLLGFFGYWSRTAELVLCMVFTYITYHQLFGYGWWSTLWRLAAVVLTQLAVMLTAVIIVIYFFGYDDETRLDPGMTKAFLFILVVSIVIAAVLLGVSYLISRRQSKMTANKYKKVN